VKAQPEAAGRGGRESGRVAVDVEDDRGGGWRSGQRPDLNELDVPEWDWHWIKQDGRSRCWLQRIAL
jgi:hypothetical protein